MGDWSSLKGSRIFITGGTGFFGKWLLEVLGEANRTLNLGTDAVVLSRDPAAFLHSMPHLEQERWLRFQVGDITRLKNLDGPFSHIIHGAASSNARHYQRDPGEMRRTLALGAQRLADAIGGLSSSRLLILSSGAIYGSQPPQVKHLPESHPPAPDSNDESDTYAQGKRDVERILSSACQTNGMASPIARCFAFAGPHLPLDQHFAFGNFVGDALQGGPIRVQGDGTSMRSYLYASELAAWLWTLTLRGLSQPYHVGSDAEVSIRELAEAIGRITGVSVQIATRPLLGMQPQRYVPAVTRMAEEFQLRPSIPLEETITRSLQWHRG